MMTILLLATTTVWARGDRPAVAPSRMVVHEEGAQTTGVTYASCSLTHIPRL
jgi:hypothetical protein